MTKQRHIPFNRPFLAGKELDYIAEAVIANQHLAGDGPFTKKCHIFLEDMLCCSKALLTHSCTAALEMVALLTDLKPGDEVIMPSFTFVSTANAFVLRGAVPVFVDIREDTLNIDETIILQAITERTRGIVPVHYAGVPCEMGRIMEIADTHGLWVAEDAAHGFLSSYNGKFLGTIGDFGCLSFHETKNIISGEGGALLINSPQYAEKAEIVREKGTNRTQFRKGMVDKYSWVDIGSSYLPSDLIAAFLYSQLEHAHIIINSRRKMIHLYNELLKPLQDEGFIRLPLIENGSVCNGHMYYIVTRSQQERSSLIEFLADQGVSAVFHYVPLHSSPAGMRFGKTPGLMSVTDEISERLLRLPLFYGITQEQTVKVADELTRFYRNKSRSAGK